MEAGTREMENSWRRDCGLRKSKTQNQENTGNICLSSSSRFKSANVFLELHYTFSLKLKKGLFLFLILGQTLTTLRILKTSCERKSNWCDFDLSLSGTQVIR